MKRPEDLLRNGITELGIPFGEDQARKFQIYLGELRKWNRAHSLTGLRTDRDIVVKHFLDSLLFLRAIPAEARSIADIGSGAGFPGIPVKIMRPGLEVFLIEPTKKKAVFLRHVCHLLELQGVTVIDERIENLKDLRVDVAATRALFSVKEFMEKAGKLLNAGGVLLMSKGPEAGKEISRITRGSASYTECRLPFANAVRHLIVIRLEGASAPV